MRSPATTIVPTTSNPKTHATVFSSATDDWPTPQTFYDQLDAEFGFVLDACASSTNHKAPVYYGLDHPDPARRDGLAGAWAADAAAGGGATFCNPPYGRGIAAWMEKAAAEASRGTTVVCLVPARTDTQWFHDHVLAAGAQVRFVKGRLRFGQATNSAPFANLVVIYRPSLPQRPVRPETDLENVLERGQGDQVRPGLTGQQVVHRRACQAGSTAHRRHAATFQRDPRGQRDMPGVSRSRRSISPKPAVGEDATDVVGRGPKLATTPHHPPHATTVPSPDPGGHATAPMKNTPCKCPLKPTDSLSNTCLNDGPGLLPAPTPREDHR